jgi:Fe2+ transport system protein FeoA
MMLDAARTGQLVTVLHASGTDGSAGAESSAGAVARRLAELGIRPGSSVRIQARTSGGGAILAIGDDRIAVSRRILAGIQVDEEVPAHG